MNPHIGRTVLITGSEGGIGVALCNAFKEVGYRVLATDIAEKSSHDLADLYFSIDLSALCQDTEYRSDALSEINSEIEKYGLNVLINNAALQIVKPIERLNLNDWGLTLDVNLLAPFVLSQYFLPQLIKSNGNIINIASIHSRLTKSEFVCYATSKAALVGMTKAMAVELGGRVRVNAISPAAISTPMLIAGFDNNVKALTQLDNVHPVGRIGKPSEVAAIAVFLASDQAAFMNGANLELDGGISSCLLDPSDIDLESEHLI